MNDRDGIDERLTGQNVPMTFFINKFRDRDPRHSLLGLQIDLKKLFEILSSLVALLRLL